RPVIGTADAMLLGHCKVNDKKLFDGGVSFYLLSDPDLLNNHGLALGDNAALVARMLPQMAGGGQVVIDYSVRIWAQNRLLRREREWSDLLRFFGPPFTILWVGMAAVMALVLWRAWVRYGATLRRPRREPGASKTVSIAAKARLMRLSGHDGALLGAYVAQRLNAVAARLLGPHRPVMSDPARPLLDWLERRNPKAGARLDAAVQAARATLPDAPAAEVARRLDDVEHALEQVINDAGRTA
ncbi:MAG: hypothetical protein AAF677_15765, partial [Pseudomonadota bacterium]